MKTLFAHELFYIAGGAGKPATPAPAQKECPCRKNRKRTQGPASSFTEPAVL